MNRGKNIKMSKSIEIISLVFKSKDYLNFIYNQLKKECNKVDGWDVGIRIVANDATDEIIEHLKTLDIPYTIYGDSSPDDYYLNRVYRCYNYAVETSEYDSVCLVNSDMAFSENWLDNLLKHHDGNNVPCSRLVESGKMPSGLHGISNDFGKTPSTFRDVDFNEYVDIIQQNFVHDNGLYMPCIFERKRFIESGMYPEGNLYKDGIGNFGSEFVMSGDKYYFEEILLKKYNMKHITIFDSLVYHIQEGEKDE
tara:strand:- start:898 stop:1653 length:756 start_codon:yes stop_codon:yes gene_type:complete